MQRPALVERAVAVAGASGFQNSCLDEVGALLHLCAGHLREGRIAELGTGWGVGTGWMASATALPIYTVDNDPERASGVKDLFADDPHVHCLLGDWQEILSYGLFQLVFVDANPAKHDGVDRIVEATEVGGVIVLDDFTPIELWPDEWTGRPDPIREAWLNHSRLVSVEVRTTPRSSAIVARRAT